MCVPLTEVWKQCTGNLNFCFLVKVAWFCFGFVWFFCLFVFEIFTFPTVERKFPESPCVIPFDMKKSGNATL